LKEGEAVTTPPLPGVDMEFGSVPITVSVCYRTYAALLDEGRLDLEDAPCP
jgi:hypothetical protein